MKLYCRPKDTAHLNLVKQQEKQSSLWTVNSSPPLFFFFFYWQPKDAALLKLWTPTNFHWHPKASELCQLFFSWSSPHCFRPLGNPAGIWTDRDTFKCIISWPGTCVPCDALRGLNKLVYWLTWSSFYCQKQAWEEVTANNDIRNSSVSVCCNWNKRKKVHIAVQTFIWGLILRCWLLKYSSSKSDDRILIEALKLQLQIQLFMIIFNKNMLLELKLKSFLTELQIKQQHVTLFYLFFFFPPTQFTLMISIVTGCTK